MLLVIIKYSYVVASGIITVLLLSHLSVRHWKAYTEGKVCTKCFLVAKGT